MPLMKTMQNKSFTKNKIMTRTIRILIFLHQIETTKNCVPTSLSDQLEENHVDVSQIKKNEYTSSVTANYAVDINTKLLL